MDVKQAPTVALVCRDTHCGNDSDETDSSAVVLHSGAVVLDRLDFENDERVGRRAMDKLMARLVSRTAGDIAQQGAAPAIVIMGDVHIGGNNVLCFGDCSAATKLAENLTPPKDEPRD